MYLDYFSCLIKSFDHALFDHSYNVGLISFLVAKKLNFSEIKAKKMFFGGILHDIGKIKIPKSILYKKAHLNNNEFETIKKHCDYGVEMLQQYKELDDYLPIIEYHHEKWNGSGYKGLKGFEIPLEARIVCIADSFDAMITERVYQKAKSMREAIEEILKCSGTQFDPHLVKVFINTVSKSISDKTVNLFNELANMSTNLHWEVSC